MNLLSFDPISVFGAALLYTLIHCFWRSRWLFHTNDAVQPISILFIGVLTAYFLFFLELHLHVLTVSDGMLLGLYVWLGFSLTTALSSKKLNLVHEGANLLSYLVMGGFIAA